MSQTSNNTTIKISTEKLAQVKEMLNQIGIQIEESNQENTDAMVELTKNNLPEDEDELEPLNTEELSKNEYTDHHENISNVDELPNPVSVEQYDSNEITPDDILEEENNVNQHDSDLDLVSDEEMPINLESIAGKLFSLYMPMFMPVPLCENGFVINGNQNDKITEIDDKIEPNIQSTCESEPRVAEHDTYVPSQKINLNIGGKIMEMKKKLLEYLGISYNRLPKKNHDNITTYFLDRDPYYFTKMIGLIKKYKSDHEKIVEKMDEFSEQFISELCFYGLIDKKYLPRLKLKLKKMVTFPGKYDSTFKIIIDDQVFETSSVTLSKSKYFDNKMKLHKHGKIILRDIEPNIFRYVLNFLRTGELFVTTDEIEKQLEKFGIEYEKIENKKVINDIATHYLPTSAEPIQNQLAKYIHYFSPQNNHIVQLDNNQHLPTNNQISANIESINIITTKSKLEFNSILTFDLTACSKNMGDCIEDLMLCVDLPVLKPTEPYEYDDLIGYQIIEYISVIINEKSLMFTNNELLYLYSLIYSNTAGMHPEIMKNNGKKIKMLYENTLIDVYRIMIPLNLFKDRKNNLPIKKISLRGNTVLLKIKIPSIKKIFKGKVKDIPLLNVCLVSNFVNLSPVMFLPNKTGTISQVPINMDLYMRPLLYIYDHLHSFTIEIQNTVNPIFDTVVIPLDKFRLIKDFFFVIVNKEDHIMNKIDRFMDDLIEMEIIQIKENQKTLNPNIPCSGGPIPYCKLDSYMLNHYLPIKYLGHPLQSGIYYYTFSTTPKTCQLNGGLWGAGYLVYLKIKKISGVVKFYATEYQQEMF